MKNKRIYLAFLLILALSLAFTGCSTNTGDVNDGTNVARDGIMDDARDDIRDGVNDMGDDVRDGIDDMRDGLEDIGDDMTDGVNDMTDRDRYTTDGTINRDMNNNQ